MVRAPSDPEATHRSASQLFKHRTGSESVVQIAAMLQSSVIGFRLTIADVGSHVWRYLGDLVSEKGGCWRVGRKRKPKGINARCYSYEYEAQYKWWKNRAPMRG
jgi:hypothetical protein